MPDQECRLSKLEQRFDDHEKSFKEHKEVINRRFDDFKVDVMTTLKEMHKDLLEIKLSQGRERGFKAGIIFTITACASVIGFLLQKIFDKV